MLPCCLAFDVDAFVILACMYSRRRATTGAESGWDATMSLTDLERSLSSMVAMSAGVSSMMMFRAAG